MSTILLFNDYEDLEKALRQLADTGHYTVKQDVAEPDWYCEDYALSIQYDGFRFDYDLNYTPTKDLKIAVNEDDWNKLKLSVRVTELSFDFYNYSKEYFGKTRVIVRDFNFDFVHEVKLDASLYLGCTSTITMRSLNEVSVATKFKLISDCIKTFDINVHEQILDTTNISNKDVTKLLVNEINAQIAYGKDKAMLFKKLRKEEQINENF